MNRRKAGLENKPDLWITQLQPAAEHPAATWPERTPGAIPGLQTLTSTQKMGQSAPSANWQGDRKEKGGREKGKEGAHRGNGSTSTNINRPGEAQGWGQNKPHQAQGRKVKLCPSTSWGGLAQQQPCGNGPRCWGRHQREQEPAGRG